MPRFFFHIVGTITEADDVGTELPSAAYAKREGARLIGALLADDLLDRSGEAVALQVTDEAGRVLFGLDVVSWEAPAMRAA